MHQNSLLYETYYLRSTTQFINECKKRGLKITADFLKECAEKRLLKPVIFVKKAPYYDLFQIPIVSEILTVTSYEMESIDVVQKSLKKRLASFEQTLPLLYQVRYFYFREMFSFTTSGILPPSEITEEQAKGYSDKFPEIYDDLLKSYVSQKFVETFKMDKRKVEEASHNIFIKGHRVDPIPNWYSLAKAIRSTDYNKFKLLQGKALLAHDYYIQAEILFLFYKDAFGAEIIAPEDILDGRVGRWKVKKCEKCGKETKVANGLQKYCQSCQKDIGNDQGATFKCINPDCGKSFYKYVDGDEVFDKPFSAVTSNQKYRRTPTSTIKTTTITRLQYGKMIVMVQCSCGTFNREVIEKGWY